jgi:hypothetical protein
MAPCTRGFLVQRPYQHSNAEPPQAQLAVLPCADDKNRLPGSGEVVRTVLNRPSQRSRLIQLHHDVLDPIVGFVAENTRDLLNLCLVSAVFYLNCVPWIYRHVVINFSNPVSFALLQRLCHVPSQISSLVRTIALRDCDQASMDQWVLLNQALSRLTRLENLSWDSHASILGSVLWHIHQYHPSASIQAYIKRMYDEHGFARNGT